MMFAPMENFSVAEKIYQPVKVPFMHDATVIRRTAWIRAVKFKQAVFQRLEKRLDAALGILNGDDKE